MTFDRLSSSRSPRRPVTTRTKGKAERGGERNHVRLVFSSRQTQVQENLYPSAPRSLLPPPSLPLPHGVVPSCVARPHPLTARHLPPLLRAPASPSRLPSISPDLPRAPPRSLPQAKAAQRRGHRPFHPAPPPSLSPTDDDADGAAAPCAGAAGGGAAGGHGVRGLHGQPVLCRPH